MTAQDILKTKKTFALVGATPDKWKAKVALAVGVNSHCPKNIPIIDFDCQNLYGEEAETLGEGTAKK